MHSFCVQCIISASSVASRATLSLLLVHYADCCQLRLFTANDKSHSLTLTHTSHKLCPYDGQHLNGFSFSSVNSRNPVVSFGNILSCIFGWPIPFHFAVCVCITFSSVVLSVHSKNCNDIVSCNGCKEHELQQDCIVSLQNLLCCRKKPHIATFMSSTNEIFLTQRELFGHEKAKIINAECRISNRISPSVPLHFNNSSGVFFLSSSFTFCLSCN